MDGWIDVWMDGWIDGWMDWCMNRWIDGWIDGSMDGYWMEYEETDLYRQINTCRYQKSINFNHRFRTDFFLDNAPWNEHCGRDRCSTSGLDINEVGSSMLRSITIITKRKYDIYMYVRICYCKFVHLYTQMLCYHGNKP